MPKKARDFYNRSDNMKKAIVSCAVGDYYTPFLKKQAEEIKRFCPNDDHIYWSGHFPPHSRTHHQSVYGFKVHAIIEAMNRGYEQVMWIDSAFYPITTLDPLWDIITDRGVFVLKDSLLLAHHTFPRVMSYFGETYESLIEKQWTISGGSPYGFNFTKPIARKIFEEFYQAERDNTFGTAEEISISSSGNYRGHRMDETVMGFIHAKNNFPLLTVEDHKNGWTNYFATQRR